MREVSSELRVTIRISYCVSGCNPRNMYLVEVWVLDNLDLSYWSVVDVLI